MVSIHYAAAVDLLQSRSHRASVVKQNYGLGSELGFVSNVITVSGFTAVGLQSAPERRFFKPVLLLPRVYLRQGSTKAVKECLTGKPVCLVSL